MNENHLKTEYKARYYSLGSDEPKRIIMACHGYGQLAQYFIKKFEWLKESNTLVIAPEGLSKFYLEGFTGRVGASWMTREDRITDIENHVRFLENLYQHLNAQHPSASWVGFGFSQGVPTICRWAHAENHHFEKLILWSGILPPSGNNDFDPSSEFFDHQNITACYGNKDPLLTTEHLEKIEELKKTVPHINFIEYEGGHEIDLDLLKSILE